jgi:hypothetical protein
MVNYFASEIADSSTATTTAYLTAAYDVIFITSSQTVIIMSRGRPYYCGHVGHVMYSVTHEATCNRSTESSTMATVDVCQVPLGRLGPIVLYVY